MNLSIAAGEMIALLGASGCGKTTLLRCIAGLASPDEGRILFGGRDITHMPTQKRPIGMVFQAYALFPNMTVTENIGFPLKVRGADAAKIRARAGELIELVGLSERAGHYPNQLSGGQQQRTALARALASDPDVLLSTSRSRRSTPGARPPARRDPPHPAAGRHHRDHRDPRPVRGARYGGPDRRHARGADRGGGEPRRAV